MTIESLPDDAKHNHFNLLRMLAASAVIVSHSHPLATGPKSAEPFGAFLGFSLGGLAVKAFFAISGYFILLSFTRRKSNADFVIARALRILPALLVVTSLTAFVIGPLLTTAPGYLGDWHVWAYPLRAASFWLWEDRLPGLFAANPFPLAVNGSLWTLFYEVSCYATLFALGVAGLIRLKWLAVLGPVFYLLLSRPAINPFFLNLGLPFCFGMLVFLYRPLCDWRLAAATLSAAVAASCLGHPIEELWSAAIALTTLSIGFARIPLLVPYNRLGDYSYGVYVYGWVTQQVLVSLVPGLTPATLTMLALPVAVGFGALSWHSVEKPAIDLRKPIVSWLKARQPLAAERA